MKTYKTKSQHSMCWTQINTNTNDMDKTTEGKDEPNMITMFILMEKMSFSHIGDICIDETL